MFNALTELLARLVTILEQLMQIVHNIWTKLSKNIDKATSRVLLIVLTVFFVIEAMFITMALVFAILLAYTS